MHPFITGAKRTRDETTTNQQPATARIFHDRNSERLRFDWKLLRPINSASTAAILEIRIPIFNYLLPGYTSRGTRRAHSTQSTHDIHIISYIAYIHTYIHTDRYKNTDMRSTFFCGRVNRPARPNKADG